MVGTHKSHFLSRFYLGGFTLTGRKEAQFWVFSKSQQRRWPMRAENAGHQRDLFRMEGPDFGPDDLEGAFSSVENDIAPVLREVLRTRKLPTDRESMSLLLHLPALNAARPPAEVEGIASMADALLRALIVEELTPEFHQQMMEKWKAAGRSTSGIADLADMKRRIAEGRVRAVLHKNHLLTYGLHPLERTRSLGCFADCSQVLELRRGAVVEA
jgi:hypothetical protein